MIAGLHKRLEWLRSHIDQAKDDLGPYDLVKLINLEGQLSNRIGRLERDKKIVTGEQLDSIESDYEVVAALAFEILGVNLG